MASQFSLEILIRQFYGQQLAASVNYYFALVKKTCKFIESTNFLKKIARKNQWFLSHGEASTEKMTQ